MKIRAPGTGSPCGFTTRPTSAGPAGENAGVLAGKGALAASATALERQAATSKNQPEIFLAFMDCNLPRRPINEQEIPFSPHPSLRATLSHPMGEGRGEGFSAHSPAIMAL